MSDGADERSEPGPVAKPPRRRRDDALGLVSSARAKLRQGGVSALAGSGLRTLRRASGNVVWAITELVGGYDTRGKIPPGELGVNSGPGYEPTRAWMLSRVVTPLPIDRSEFTFIDLGSGKGRVLLMAARLGFRTLIGVEYNGSLAEISRQNGERYERGHPKTRFETRAGDAGAIELPDAPLVIFMFNPFGREVMTRVVAAIEASYAAHPRPIYVTYWNPKELETVAGSAVLEPFLLTPYYCIYQTPAAAARP